MEKKSSIYFASFLGAALLFGTAASAEVCPDGVRTVDFGLPSNNGQLQHGGVAVRVHDGVTSLLGPDGMDCYPLLSGESNPTDEDGFPIPLGHYVDLGSSDGSGTTTSLVITRAFSQEDAEFRADNQIFFDAMLGSDKVARIETETSLCLVDSHEEAAVNCVIKPLSTKTVSAIALCSSGECAMLTAIGDSLVVTALWQYSAAGLSQSARAHLISEFAINAITYVESQLSNRTTATSR